MSASFNKVFLLGHLGRDPEIRYSPQGTAVVSFSLATNDYVAGYEQSQKNGKTTWHSITAFSKLAENLQLYLKKGSQVFLEGRLNQRSWEDSQSQKRWVVEVIAEKVQFLTPIAQSEQLLSPEFSESTSPSVAADIQMETDGFPF